MTKARTNADNASADIQGVTAGTGLSGGGTSGTVTLDVDTTVVATTSNTITMTNKTLTSPTVTTPTLTLAATSSTTSGRISFDASADKLYIGDGSQAVEFASSTLITNARTASYTLALADKDKLVEVSNAAANTVTIPTNTTAAFPIGTQINIIQTGAGQTTISGTSGVTVNSTGATAASPKLRAQWSTATAIKRGTDTWVVIGDIS
jgi:hypothetical protein